jgi:hypothetical protein
MGCVVNKSMQKRPVSRNVLTTVRVSLSRGLPRCLY